jgi:hypothetical protein
MARQLRHMSAQAANFYLGCEFGCSVGFIGAAYPAAPLRKRCSYRLHPLCAVVGFVAISYMRDRISYGTDGVWMQADMHE